MLSEKIAAGRSELVEWSQKTATMHVKFYRFNNDTLTWFKREEAFFQMKPFIFSTFVARMLILFLKHALC